MKTKILIVGFLLCLQLPSFAQSKIGYVYDAAGNRIRREIVLERVQVQSKLESRGASPASNLLPSHKILIYPNPTVGTLYVKVDKFSKANQGNLSIYNTAGNLIGKQTIQNETTRLNVSEQPAGIYLLKINLDGKSITWKIIKK